MDRAAFFAAVRANPFGGKLSQSQVQGLNAILDAAPKGIDPKHLAYCLATAFHETSRTMQPIEEYGRGKGKPYGVGGWYGRGYVQLTWSANYAKAGEKLGIPLVAKPSLALQPDVAAQIMFVGMAEGWFTGKKLADYFPPGAPEADPVGARRIINGTDKAKEIAAYYRAFLLAITAAQAKRSAAAPPSPKGQPMIPLGPILGQIVADAVTAVAHDRNVPELAQEDGHKVAAEVVDRVQQDARVDDIAIAPDPKPWWQSKVIWTNLVGTVATIGAVWGLNLTPEMQATIVTVIVALMGLLSSLFRAKTAAPLKA
jgi:putative chitinase